MMFIPKIFNKPIKASLSAKKYPNAIQTHPTQILNSIFLIDKTVKTGFLKIIVIQNQLHILFGIAFICIMISKTIW